MELKISLQNDTDGRATRALDETLKLSRFKDSVTWEEIPEPLEIEEDIKNFKISFVAGIAATVFVELIQLIIGCITLSLSSSCRTQAKVTNYPPIENEHQVGLVIDAENAPSKEEIENFIQEVKIRKGWDKLKRI